MLKRLCANPLMIILWGGACLSFTPGNENHPSSSNPTVQGVKPGVSDDSYPDQRPEKRATGQEEIAQNDAEDAPRSSDGHFRMGDWDYRENWRYNRDAFFSGKSQAQAYREEHPYGPGGIGFDADVNYERNLKRYRELYQKNPSRENREELNNYVNPYHEKPYRGNYGEGSANDAYRDR